MSLNSEESLIIVNLSNLASNLTTSKIVIHLEKGCIEYWNSYRITSPKSVSFRSRNFKYSLPVFTDIFQHFLHANFFTRVISNNVVFLFHFASFSKIWNCTCQSGLKCVVPETIHTPPSHGRLLICTPPPRIVRGVLWWPSLPLRNFQNFNQGLLTNLGNSKWFLYF